MSIPATPLSRRLFLGGSLSALLVGGLAACTDSAKEPEPEATPTPTFPVTVDHMYGKTTVKTDPQRIVVIGYNEQDILQALGVKPIATTQLAGDAPHAVYPWAVDKLGDAKPTVLEAAEGLQLEEIKKLEPDLIIGTNAGLDQETYDELTKIAPTIPNSGSSGTTYYERWQIQTVLVGQALGREQQAQDLVNDLVQRYADVAAAHPHWDGVTAALVSAPYDDGSTIAWPDGLGTDFLTDLGFVIPASLDKYVDDEVEQAQIPGDKATVLNDAKVLVWATDTEDGSDIENDKVLKKLEAVKDGRSIFTGEPLTSAIFFSSILSLPFVLDQLVPRLERTLPA